MKKLLFSALACVAFAGSSFASNEVVNEVEANKGLTVNLDFDAAPCRFNLCVYHPETGEAIYGYDYIGTAGSADECFNKGLRMQEELSLQYPGMNVSMEIM